jgi:hypothetical protein
MLWVLYTEPSAATTMFGAGGGRSKNAFAGTTSINSAENSSAKASVDP